MSEIKRKQNYLKQNIYVRAEDAIYIREKLGREPTSSDFVEALLSALSQK